MAVLSESQIQDLIAPYLAGGPELDANLIPQISRYMDLLLLWNAKTNLTAIREPETLVQRQIGESLFAARLISGTGTFLDFGSGGGFPGIPLQLGFPKLRVVLAESQGKKGSFLREVVRTLGLTTEVWSSRVEAMPTERRFDVVALRAVDQTASMLPIAQDRVASGGALLRYLSAEESDSTEGWQLVDSIKVVNSPGRLACWTRDNVPRGTATYPR